MDAHFVEVVDVETKTVVLILLSRIRLIYYHPSGYACFDIKGTFDVTKDYSGCRYVKLMNLDEYKTWCGTLRGLSNLYVDVVIFGELRCLVSKLCLHHVRYPIERPDMVYADIMLKDKILHGHIPFETTDEAVLYYRSLRTL